MRLFLASLFAGVFYVSIYSQEFNQKVPFDVCELVYDTTSCFTVDNLTPAQVGIHVKKLNDSFRFCLDSALKANTPPIQVILALDQSSSMKVNDAGNKRAQAAHDFVSELRAKSPKSYVGAVVFFYRPLVASHRPVQLFDTLAYGTLWDTIESSARPPKPRPPVLTKTLATLQGFALRSALDMLKDLRATAPEPVMKQHVIMITDDGWYENADIMPHPLLNEYRSQFPDGKFPQVHTVVLTESGKPQEGGVQGLANVKLIADETGGMYIEDATPETIVAELSKILQKLTPRMDKLQGVTMKNLTTGESHEMNFDSVPGAKNAYIVSGSDWDLADGDNIFVFEKKIMWHDSTTSTLIDTMKITRSANTISNILSVDSRLECKTSWPGASFTAMPESLLVNETVNAKVQIDPTFTFPYVLNDVSLKGFTTSNASDADIMSLFKLDSNLNNIISSGTSGDGTPDFNKHTGAFGGSMIDGSFTTNISLPSDEFSFDFWVKSDESSDKTLLSSDNFSLSMDKNGFVTFAIGSVSVKSKSKIYKNVWSNIAVVRRDGKVTLFINGLSASDAAEVELSGDQTITVAAGSGFTIDELRFNSKSKVTATKFGPTYGVAQVTGMKWTLIGRETTDEIIDIPNSTWNNNAVHFSISRKSAGQVILNMTKLDARISWAVNSNPVEFVSPFPDPAQVIAYVLDKDGNGFIDNIRFTVQDTNILADNLPSPGDYFKSLSITTHFDKDVTFHPDVMERIDDKTFNVKLKENSINFETGWKSDNFSTNDITAMASGGYTEIIRVVDSAGPVIVRVQFEKGEEGTKTDKLKIQFSEPISLVQEGVSVPSDMFNYYQRKIRSTKALESIGPDDFQFTDQEKMNADIIMTNGFFVLPQYDSLQLKKAPSHIVDGKNVSANDPSRIAQIEGFAPSVITLKPASNPYVPGTEIPEQIRNYYSEILNNKNNNVLLVAIKSTLPLQMVDDGSYGEVIIYDGVGNIVQRDLKVYMGEIETDYAFLWNAKNLNNRNVNRGVYLAIVKVKDTYNTQHVFREKLGIK